MGRHHCPSTFLHSRRIITNLSKMSEVDAKTDAPTAEEIKGTKRAAEDEIEEAKKQKTENGSNGKAAVIEVENGAGEEEEDLVEGEEDEADPEEEEDLDEGDDAEGKKRKMVRAKKRKKVTNKSHFLDDLIQRFLYTKSSDNDYYLKKFKSETSIKRLLIKNIKNNNS